MAYGYREWRKEEGSDKSPRLGALERAYAVLENLQYPRHKWGMIRPNELEDRLRRMMGQGGEAGAADWDKALEDVLTFLKSSTWPVYCFDKIESKPLVAQLKTLIKEAGGSVDGGKEEKDDGEE